MNAMPGATDTPRSEAPVRTTAVYAALGGLLVVVVACALLTGAGEGASDELRGAILRLRMGRTAAAFIAGGALAVGGVLVQGLFRNPLASPEIVGATSGAALGGRLALLSFDLLLIRWAPGWLGAGMFLPIGCVLGALLALALLLLVTRTRRDLVLLLLAGFLLTSLLTSVGGFVFSLAQDRWEVSRAILAFSLGDVAGTGLEQVVVLSPIFFVGSVAAFGWGRALDVMLSGEDEAATLGVDVPTVRRWVVVWTGLLTGAAVAVGGSVGFVGLVVPHALRPWLGPTHRRLVPAAALGGGVFLVACDLLTRVMPTRSEVPLGVITGLVGAPVFLFLLLRRGGELLHGRA